GLQGPARQFVTHALNLSSFPGVIVPYVLDGSVSSSPNPTTSTGHGLTCAGYIFWPGSEETPLLRKPLVASQSDASAVNPGIFIASISFLLTNASRAPFASSVTRPGGLYIHPGSPRACAQPKPSPLDHAWRRSCSHTRPLASSWRYSKICVEPSSTVLRA